MVVEKRFLPGRAGNPVEAAAGMFGGDVEVEFLWHVIKVRLTGIIMGFPMFHRDLGE